MTKDEKRRKYCSGCRDNFYNGNQGPGGAEECWHLESAKPVRMKFVHVDQRPPWNQKAEWTLDCCHRERFIKVRPEVVR